MQGGQVTSIVLFDVHPSHHNRLLLDAEGLVDYADLVASDRLQLGVTEVELGSSFLERPSTVLLQVLRRGQFLLGQLYRLTRHSFFLFIAPPSECEPNLAHRDLEVASDDGDGEERAVLARLGLLAVAEAEYFVLERFSTGARHGGG